MHQKNQKCSQSINSPLFNDLANNYGNQNMLDLNLLVQSPTLQKLNLPTAKLAQIFHPKQHKLTRQHFKVNSDSFQSTLASKDLNQQIMQVITQSKIYEKQKRIYNSDYQIQNDEFLPTTVQGCLEWLNFKESHQQVLEKAKQVQQSTEEKYNALVELMGSYKKLENKQRNLKPVSFQEPMSLHGNSNSNISLSKVNLKQNYKKSKTQSSVSNFGIPSLLIRPKQQLSPQKSPKQVNKKIAEKRKIIDFQLNLLRKRIQNKLH